MDYRVSDGIDEQQLSAWLKEAAKRHGTFEDGRVNYAQAQLAPAVMCVLKCGDKIFLAKRNHNLADANGYWSLVNGFIDKNKPVAKIAAQELKEELGLRIDSKSIKVAPSFTIKGNGEKRAYIIFPCLAEVYDMPEIKLDYEHTDFKWINREDLEKYHILSDLPMIVDAALNLR